MNQVLTAVLLAASATPTPTDPPFDPVDVTPGPIGFFATAALFIAVGLIAMSLMRRSVRANARFDIREELEREAAEQEAAERAAEPDAQSQAAPEATVDGDAGNGDGEPRA